MARILERWWAPLAVFLLALMAAGVAFLFAGGGAEEPLVILPPPPSSGETVVYVGGAVDAPGFYTLREGDTLDDLLRAAGGTTPDADLSQVRIIVPERGQDALPQRININTAPPWLLEALPGIGPKLAQAIVDDRPFRSIRDLTRVKGIGPDTYGKIKDRITVGD
ncbi:MAG: helix-hairpin-helix domain-containing protein [Dehalococcoidia bacterium]